MNAFICGAWAGMLAAYVVVMLAVWRPTERGGRKSA